MDEGFQDRVFIACLKESYKNDSIFRLIEKEDIFNPYEGFYIFDDIVHRADSLGSSVAKKLAPTGYRDYEGKNYYMSHCLLYYTSKELDAIARGEFEKYKEMRGEEY